MDTLETTVATGLLNKAAETNGFGYGLVGIILIVLLGFGCVLAIKFVNAHFEHIKELRENNAQQSEVTQEFSKQISNLAATIQVVTQALNENKSSTSQSLAEVKNQLTSISNVAIEVKSAIGFCANSRRDIK